MTQPLPDPPSYEQLLRDQSAVLARWQAVTGGLSKAAWEWRRDRGTWQTVLPGIVVAHSGEVTFEQKVQAAVLYGGDGAAVSGDALLHLTRTTRRRGEPPDVIDVAVRAESKVSAHLFFRPHRCSRLDEITHPVRLPQQVRIAPAVLRSAAWAKSDRAAEWRLAAAVQQRLVTVPALRAALQTFPRLPRRRTVTAGNMRHKEARLADQFRAASLA